MRNYIEIEEAVNRLRNEFNWHDSFIRELYLVNGRCLVEYKNSSGVEAIGDTGHSMNLRLVVAASGHPSIFGIEFLCADVQVFSLQRLDELFFNLYLEKDVVRLELGNSSLNSETCWISAKSIHVAFLGKEYLGPWLRLGYELPHEDAISATKVDECWRQCGNCSNAWAEKPESEYSRCPECGNLTRLVSRQGE